MQKIDTKNIPLSTQIVRAVVNNKRKIRVYVNQERVGEFDTMQEAIKFYDRIKREGQGDGRVLHEEHEL